ncbi:NOP58 family protein [Candidatus Micrarchaeota archaeon]|nr:NOP58 family protein [Candidatus Micrarchaeota archaeon]
MKKGDMPRRREGFGGKRALFMKKSKESVKEALKSRDMLLTGVTKSIEDLDKTINLLGERLEDWYGVYFPEIKENDKIRFSHIVLIVDRENLDKKELASEFGQKAADSIAASAEKSLGANLSAEDLAECQSLASSIISLGKLREKQVGYQTKIAGELCPNLSEVGTPEIAAKLVSHVGSLSRLAMLPASAIQVIGAEKALFKHLKNKRIPPPKHGIIFQHAKISSSPKKVRGKIARTLANNLSMAAKADAFTKNKLGLQLREKFEKRYAEIMKQYEREKKE